MTTGKSKFHLFQANLLRDPHPYWNSSLQIGWTKKPIAHGSYR